jgi:hypothetical protein
MKAKEARTFIGKGVEWDEPTRISLIPRRGYVEDVKGKNVLINGDWKWLPDIKEFRLIETKNNP